MSWSLQHFVNSEDIANLERWRYKVIDNSITTQLYTPFWNFVVSLLPRWLAPNVVTLLGLICTIAVFYVCTTMPNNGSRAVVIVVLLFLYQTLDAADGKHARKLRNGSPIGELCDHACDNVSTIFCAYQLATLLLPVGNDGSNSALSPIYPAQQWLVLQAAMLVFLHEHTGNINQIYSDVRMTCTCRVYCDLGSETVWKSR